MALDSYDRIAALNAVVEAWTRRGSNPLVKKFSMNGNSSKNFTCTTGWIGILITCGNGLDVFGIFEAYALPTIVFGKSLTGMTTLSVSGLPSAFTITNSSSRNLTCIMISLDGIFEEV